MERSEATPAASTVALLSSRHAFVIAVFIYPLLHVAVVTVVGRILGPLPSNRATGIVALNGNLRLIGIAGFEPPNRTAAEKA